MNLNQLAKAICDREGLKKQLTIADVKEVLHVMAEICAEEYINGSQDSWAAFRNYALTFVKKHETKKRKSRP